jgi:putative hemolysin
MKTRIRMVAVMVALSAVLVGGCRPTTQRVSVEEAQAGLPNPAALYCEEQGGEYDIRTASDGSQDGACVFGDGSECDGWAFYRGECLPGPSEEEPASAAPATAEPESAEAGEDELVVEDGDIAEMANPASVYCEEQGGQLEIRSDEEGNQLGICVFEDGTECEEWTYFLSECGPAAKQAVEAQAPKLIYGWYGLVGAPAPGEPGGFTLNLLPEALGTVELVTTGEDVEANLEASLDGATPVHVWGVLTCDLAAGCWLEATQLVPEGTQETLTPDPVDGWLGTVEALPSMAQFDDVFILEDPNFPVQYGIDAPDPGVAAELESLRNTGRSFFVFGELSCNVIDVYGCQIRADRIEVKP